MNNHRYPPSKKPRLNIERVQSSQIPGTSNDVFHISSSQLMDVGGDWEDDNLFIEAADEFDKLIAASQAIPPTNNDNIPVQIPNCEKKFINTNNLSILNFGESSKNSKINGNQEIRFQKSKSFNLDQVASSFQNHNSLASSPGIKISETNVKQSDLYQMKCGENQILQKQIQCLTKEISDNKNKANKMLIEKEKEKSLLRDEMSKKVAELKQELDRLNTELLFEKNVVKSSDFKMKNAKFKEPESPSTSNSNRFVDKFNASITSPKNSKRNSTSPSCLNRKGNKLEFHDNSMVHEQNPQDVFRIDQLSFETHFGSMLYNIIGENLLKLESTDGSNLVVRKFGGHLIRLVTCKSFTNSKAKQNISLILSECNEVILKEVNNLKQLELSEDKEESLKRDHILTKSCFTVLLSGKQYDLFNSKKLFPAEEGSELRRCIKLIAVLCSLSSYALSLILYSSVELMKQSTIISNIEPLSTEDEVDNDDTNTRLESGTLLNSINDLVTVIASQNRTKAYNGTLLSISHLILEVFHQKVCLSDINLKHISSIIKELILSRPAPSVLETCVTILSESTYCYKLQEHLCGQAKVASFQTNNLLTETIHSFTNKACAIRVLCTCLELIFSNDMVAKNETSLESSNSKQKSSDRIISNARLVKAYLTWILKLLHLKRINCGRTVGDLEHCDCNTEIFNLFLLFSWFSVQKLAKEFKYEEDIMIKQEIRDCVELSYRSLSKLKNQKELQFLHREGIFKALILRTKTLHLDISIEESLFKGLTLEKEPIPQDRTKTDDLRTMIYNDVECEEEFDDLDE